MKQALVLLALMILFLVASLGQQPPTVQPSQPKVRASDDTHTNLQKQETIKPAPPGSILTSQASPCTCAKCPQQPPSKEESSSLATYTLWLMCFTGLLVVATLLLVIVGVLQWCTFRSHKQSFDKMELWMKENVGKTGELVDATTMLSNIQRDQHRAWIDILHIQYVWSFSETRGAVSGVSINYEVKNSGILPAHIQDHSCWLEQPHNPLKSWCSRAVKRQKRIMAREESSQEHEEFCLEEIDDFVAQDRDIFLVNSKIHIRVSYVCAQEGREGRTEKIIGYDAVHGRFYEDGSEAT